METTTGQVASVKEDLSLSGPFSFRPFHSDLKFAQGAVDSGEYNSVQEALRSLLHEGVVARGSDQSALLSSVARMCRAISKSQLEVAEQIEDVIEAIKTRSPLILEGWTEGFSDSAQVDDAPPVVLINTNRQENEELEAEMVAGQYAAVYYDPWQRQMRNSVRTSMLIVLYASGVGAIAYGIAVHDPKDRTYRNDPVQPNTFETYVELDGFKRIEPPIAARDMKKVMDYQVNLRRAVRPLPEFAGQALYKHLMR